MSQTLRDSSELLKPYVPRLLIRWLAEEPHLPFRTIEGSMVFVDISGFTKMSERLARHGKVGAEEVTDVLGAVFAKLLAVAYGEDGSLLKFGGDALLLWFSGPGHAVRAASAAHGMRATLRSVGQLDTTAGKVVLRMSVGVNSGSFHFFLVGDSHRELVVTGPAASQTVTMESTATAGEILVSRETAAALPAETLGQPKGDGVLLKRGPSTLAFDRDDVEIPISSIDVVACIPTALRDHLLSGATEPEHRNATIAFVHFDEVDGLLADRGADVVAARLHELIAVAQHYAEQNGVTFLGTDIDHDGGKVILVAGAPSAIGDEEGRMLLTLRSIVDAGTELPVRIGVNKGNVFAGDVGPSYRRTYTVIGDAVNLAARVMSMAVPGQILATGPVLDASSVAFNAVALEPFMVKGKKDPVHASMVGHSTGSKHETALRRVPARRPGHGDGRVPASPGRSPGRARITLRGRWERGHGEDPPLERVPIGGPGPCHNWLRAASSTNRPSPISRSVVSSASSWDPPPERSRPRSGSDSGRTSFGGLPTCSRGSPSSRSSPISRCRRPPRSTTSTESSASRNSRTSRSTTCRGWCRSRRSS